MNAVKTSWALILTAVIAAALAQPFSVNVAASVNRQRVSADIPDGDQPNVPIFPPPSATKVAMAPTTATWYLHDANTVVGSTTYLTINSSAVTGTADNITASTGAIGVKLFTEQASGNRSVFVSPAVPSGNIWTLSGNWTFNAYMRTAATGGYGLALARLYKINSAGNLTWICNSVNDTSDAIGSTTYALFTWDYVIPTTVLRAGERFGVEFLVKVSQAGGTTAYLGYDDTSPTTMNSSIRLTYEQTALSSVALAENHYRIGYNRPLNSMQYREYTDSPPLNIPLDKNFRVRFQVSNIGTASVSWRPQLEWSTSSNSGFAAVLTTSGANPFWIAPTDNFTNGATIATADFGLDASSGTAYTGVAYDTENPPSTNVTLPSGNYTEIEFNVRANSNAYYNTTYYFRLSNTGTAFTIYDDVASITTQLQHGASDPHNAFTTSTFKCAACHRAHTGNSKEMRKTGTSEQTLCLSCHDGTGASTNINALLSSGTTHNVSSTNWTHAWNETSNTSFNGTNRHVECEDCHEPHSVYPRTRDTGNYAVSPMNNRAWGIGVNNTAANTSPTYLTQGDVSYEFQICFKCHSSWAYGNSPPWTPGGTVNSTSNATNPSHQTNIALEFNTLNYSHHAVEGMGNNQPPLWANPNWAAGNQSLGLGNNFVSPWTANSTVQCGDCHGPSSNTSPSGPHGTTLRWMVKPYTGNASVSSTAIFCYNCHAREVYGDMNDYAVTDNITFKHLWSRFNHRAGFISRNTNHYQTGAGMSNDANRWGIWCMTCHGGDVLGGIHGTNRGVGTSGTTILGKRFLNGAAVAGFTVGNSTLAGTFYQKASADAVMICTQHNGGQSLQIANWNYNPVP